MRKLFVIGIAALLVLGVAMSAAAVIIDQSPGNELSLNQIVQNSLFGGLSYSSSQDFADAYPIVETLPANTQITVTAYAKYAGFTQDAGIYTAGNAASVVSLGSPFPTSSNGIVDLGPNDIVLTPAVQFGFADVTSSGGTKYTELLLNNGGDLGQSNGLIFKISPTHYIVAFEDGAGVNSLGDRDYNDLVLNVYTLHAPAPPSAILMGSGLLGLLGLRRFRII